MRTSKSLRVFALLLVLCMAAALFVACKDSKDNPDDTKDSGTVDTSDPSSETTNTDIVRQLYGDKDYGGKSLRILGYAPDTHWYNFVSNGFNEVWFENDSADALSSAIYTRNRRTEDLLNLTIVPTLSDNVSEVIEATMTADDDLFDLFAIALSNTYDDLARNGRVLNYYNIDSIDMTHDWWDQQLISDLTMFGNKLYAMSGDAFAFDDYSVALFIFNKEMIETYDLENPYDHVRAGTWTFDTMMSMAHAVTNDKNNDGHMDELDTWGSSCYYGALYHLIYACDTTLTVNDYLGTPTLNINSDDVVDKITNLYYDVLQSGDMMLSGYTDDAIEMLANGDMLFYHTLVSHIGLLRGYEFDYGLLPLPKYNESQTRYTTPINTAWYTCYSIPRTEKDIDFVGTAIETLSGFSTDTVDSTIYDTLLGQDSQLMRDDDSVEMLKILFNGKLFDWSGFDAGGIKDVLLSQSLSNSFTYISQTEIVYDSVEAQLNEYIAAFEALS